METEKENLVTKKTWAQNVIIKNANGNKEL